jgi:hypothetical protein
MAIRVCVMPNLPQHSYLRSCLLLLCSMHTQHAVRTGNATGQVVMSFTFGPLQLPDVTSHTPVLRLLLLLLLRLHCAVDIYMLSLARVAGCRRCCCCSGEPGPWHFWQSGGGRNQPTEWLPRP